MPGGPGKINEYNKSLTPEQRKENARRAGLKSGEGHRRNSDIREIARLINEAPANDSIRKSMAGLNVDDEALTNAAGIAMAVYRAALKGNMAAVEKWEQYVGQAESERRDDGILEDVIRELMDDG